ncbi:MAG: glycosyltransferase family 4 protein [Dehalococcoidia bacterium]|nr:glycosyltransferase family 4 protein [Dehalococcoidia bacterium]
MPFAPEGLGRLPLVRRNWTLRGSLQAASRIRAELRRGAIDAMFLHTQTISVFAGGLMNRIPTLLSLDATPANLDTLGGAYAHDVNPAVVERLKRAAHRRVVARARQFTTWSQWAKDSLVTDYGADAKRVTVIHPGTNIDAFAARAGAPRPPGRPLQLLFVGGDFVRKGGDLLLDVYRRSLRETCELHIVTATDVPSGEGVHVYHGLKPHAPELIARYADADVFVLPTRGDCLAVVMGEAMAASLPIVTTTVGAHREAVEDGGSGYLIGVDDADALASRLRALAADRALAARLGRRSRAIGEERFDIARGAAQIADMLVALADERGVREMGRVRLAAPDPEQNA